MNHAPLAGNIKIDILYRPDDVVASVRCDTYHIIPHGSYIHQVLGYLVIILRQGKPVIVGHLRKI